MRAILHVLSCSWFVRGALVSLSLRSELTSVWRSVLIILHVLYLLPITPVYRWMSRFREFISCQWLPIASSILKECVPF